MEPGTLTKPASCTDSDIESGRMLHQERSNAKTFGKDAKGKWVDIEGDAYWDGPFDISSFCNLPDGRIEIAIHIPYGNSDIGRFLHLVTDKRWLHFFTNGGKITRKMLGIINPLYPGLKQNYLDNGANWITDAIAKNVRDGVPDQIDTLLKNNGEFPAELETEELIEGSHN